MKYEKRHGITKAHWKEISKMTKYCSHCGHSILFQSRTNKIICKWCGHWVYNNKKDEFKDRLLQKKKRVENES